MLINYDQASFSTTVQSNPYERIEHQFEDYAGPHAIEKLRNSVTSNLVITLGGDQLTGKSTLSKRLQQLLDGKLVSAGTFFRARAAELGISVPALSRQALSDPSIDISIDYSLCSAICKGDDRKILILEGRQPSVMATFMNIKCKKEQIIRIFLYCSPLEQALRYMEREVGSEELSIAKRELSGKEWNSLHEIGKEIKRLVCVYLWHSQSLK
jgi:cytidylate kinase